MVNPSPKAVRKKPYETTPEPAPVQTGLLPVFGNKPFMRFVKRFGTSHAELLKMLEGVPEADLGGAVFKFRLARPGEGKSGGARTIVAMRAKTRAVLMFGFEKKDQANVTSKELRSFKKLATVYLTASAAQIEVLLKAGELDEIKRA